MLFRIKKFRLPKILIILIFVLHFSSCSNLIQNKLNKQARTPSNVSTCLDLIENVLEARSFNKRDFATTYGQFKLNLETLPQKKQDKIRNIIEATTFIDYRFAHQELLNVSTKGSGLSEASFPLSFNKEYSFKPFHFIKNLFIKTKRDNKFKEDAFGNFLKARNFILNDPEITIENLKKAHRILMVGEIEGLDKKHLGEIGVSAMRGEHENISPAILNAYKNNPYLSTEFNKREKNGKVFYSGYVSYASINNIHTNTLKEINKYNKNLYSELKKYQKNAATFSHRAREELQKKYVTALSEELLKWFVKQRDQLGELDNALKIDQYIELVAKLQRDFISIHPFRDGNGRTSREFLLNLALMKEGLPPPRLFDPNLDIGSSLEDWKEQIILGMEATTQLYLDLNKRIELNLVLEDSPELVLPFIKRYVSIDGKTQGKQTLEENLGFVKTNMRDFMSFMKFHFKKNPELKESDKLALSLRKIEEKYLEFVRKNNVHFRHKKQGDQLVQLHFVDEEFINLFANKSYQQKGLWNYKMKNWYKDELNWRGISYSNQSVDQEEILSMFSNVHNQMVSNNLMGKIANTDFNNIRSKVKKEFLRYNDELYNGGITNLALDHSREGAGYTTSYGYSTSQKRSVGKAFAMGAMVVAEYGKHQEFQHLIKSRILIAAKRSKKDVDLMKLRTVRPEYWNAYPRQAEVMGIGAADPDSIMLVQSLDSFGAVIESYIRNPKRPEEIWIIKGEGESLANIQEELVLDKVILD